MRVRNLMAEIDSFRLETEDRVGLKEIRRLKFDVLKREKLNGEI